MGNITHITKPKFKCVTSPVVVWGLHPSEDEPDKFDFDGCAPMSAILTEDTYDGAVNKLNALISQGYWVFPVYDDTLRLKLENGKRHEGLYDLIWKSDEDNKYRISGIQLEKDKWDVVTDIKGF